MLSLLHFVLYSLSLYVLAVPIPFNLPSLDQVADDITGGSLNTTSDPTTPVSQSTINSDFVRPAQFARVAYCSSQAVTSWDCGAPCEVLGNDITVLQAGGDDGDVPLYYVAHDPSTSSIILAHQGTDPANFSSVLNDAEFALTDINITRFPAADGLSVQVHDGFQATFERTADSVLQGVQNGLSSTGSQNLVITGHSLGAALALINTMFLKPQLDPSVSVTTTVFGLPRVGNQAWADLVDATIPDGALTRISNQADPVPRVPPLALGFRHPQGEVHINAVNSTGDATNIVSCPGQENALCSDANDLLDVSILNHLGPYFDDISFGSPSCPV